MPRLFVALRPPLPVIDALFDTMEAVEGARWRDEEQLHITLAFCGEVDEPAAQDLAASLARVDFAPFDVTVSGVGHFEHKGRVDAIWAGVVPSSPLLDLQRRVAEACTRAGVEPERRRYVPHITVARIYTRCPDVPAWLARHGTLALPPFTVSAFGLYESHLSHGPVFYEELMHYPAPQS